ncbi:hypothetical protein HYS50_03225 [Candidatus Woesearchaeota archaeon]|nr:hypothetical protein [Candidatus Woesearchaeota archaeon]
MTSIPVHEPDILLKHLRKDILLDTGPLLLLLVGKYNSSLLPAFKRLSGRTEQEFMKLQAFLSKFRKIVVTPHVLAEMSNLAKSLGENTFSSFLERCVEDLKKFGETFIDKDEIIKRDEFKHFGITDTGIIIAGEKNYEHCVVMVQEEYLRRKCDNQGLCIINFWDVITGEE